MAASDKLRNDPAANYDGPPDYRAVGRHAIFPDTSHDEIERLNYLAQMNRHLATRIMPHVKTAYESRVEPVLAQEGGPRTRHDVRRGLNKDPVTKTVPLHNR